MKIFKVFVTIILFSFGQNVIAQKAEIIDSLWQNYRYAENDSLKLKSANFLAFHYIFRKPERADSILTSASAFAKQEELNFGLTELTNTRGIYYDVLGQKDSSKVYFKRALDLSRQYDYPTIEVMCINNLGMFCWNNGQFKEALDYFFQALDYSQIHNPDNDKGQSVYLNNIGLIHQELNQYERAIDYHLKALEIRTKYDLTKDMASSYNNLAICYKSLYKLVEAEKYIKLAIDFASQSNQPKMFYQFHDNLGNILNLQKKYTEAEEAYLTALDMPEDYKNFNRNKFTTYSNLINVYNNIRQYDKALKTITKAKAILESDSTLYNFSESYFINSAKTHFALQNNDIANTYFDKYISFKDSLFSKENAQALADVEAKLRTKEKEAELAVTKASLLEKDIEVRQKNLLFYGSLSAIVILLVIGYLIIKSNRLKNKQLKKEAELQKALTKIELKNKLEEQRLRISRDLHDNIGSQLTFVISGLQYMQLQKRLNPSEVKSKLKELSQFTQKTIHELRDTIWAMNKDEVFLADLIQRLRKFISQIDLKEKISISIPDENELISVGIKFNAVQAIQIFRIVQEVVNNAIKHAEANEIQIKINFVDNIINFNIIDDGKGYETGDIEYGNGLKNLEKRAKQLKADLQIRSVVNKGTSVSLKIRFTPKH